MTPTIAIYVEGGGDSKEGRAQLRQGFDALLRPQKDAACADRLRWKLVMCGSRQETYRDFIAAVKRGDDGYAVLLVDSEGPVAGQGAATQLDHLNRRDGWDLSLVSSDHVHLMVQCMEAWIVADPDAVERFYGQRFNRSALPRRKNLEEEPKDRLCRALERASKGTQKGQYRKIKHASKLLALIDPSLVSVRCPRFFNLTTWLNLFANAAAVSKAIWPNSPP